MARNRLIGDYPVIGIRPVIDARKGILDIRSSLEEQTMRMARAVKELIMSSLTYSNGEPVQAVVFGHTIGRAAEAAACARSLEWILR